MPPRDPAALADAINRILNSPELAAKLAKAGRALIEERFSAAKMAAQYEAVYQSLSSTKNMTFSDVHRGGAEHAE